MMTALPLGLALVIVEDIRDQPYCEINLLGLRTSSTVLDSLAVVGTGAVRSEPGERSEQTAHRRIVWISGSGAVANTSPPSPRVGRWGPGQRGSVGVRRESGGPWARTSRSRWTSKAGRAGHRTKGADAPPRRSTRRPRVSPVRVTTPESHSVGRRLGPSTPDDS